MSEVARNIERITKVVTKGGNDATLMLMDEIDSLTREVASLKAEMDARLSEMDAERDLTPLLQEIADALKALVSKDAPEMPEVDLTETNLLLEKLINREQEPVNVIVKIV